MSLINEALKRAKEAKAAPPPAAGPQFRPVDPQPERDSRSTVMVVSAFSLVLVLALLLAWLLIQRNGAASTAVRASEAPNIPAVPVKQTAPAVSLPKPVAARQVASPSIEPSSVAAIKTEVSAQPASTAPPAAAATVDPVVATPITAAIEPPPKPAPPKLQGIVFNPTRPSAMINGRTLFIGEKFGELRLVAITSDSATLVGGGRTNVLSLEQ